MRLPSKHVWNIFVIAYFDKLLTKRYKIGHNETVSKKSIFQNEHACTYCWFKVVHSIIICLNFYGLFS
jgi:hypothetical protein